MNVRLRRFRLFLWLFLGFQVLLWVLVSPIPVYADDCLSDPLNAADCMRTPGFRQITAVAVSTAATISAVLVNVLGNMVTSRTQPPNGVSDPEVENAVRAWEQVAQQADLEAEKYVRQWDEAVSSADPNDPGFQNLQSQYQDYIEDQRRQADEARRKMQEIIEQEQQHQQEVRQQQAYKRHRQEEAGFIEREKKIQAQRQGAFDRQMDQLVGENQQKMEQLKIKQKQARYDDRKMFLELRQASDMADARSALAAGKGFAFVEDLSKAFKWSADKGMDVCCELLPGVGRFVKPAYQIATGTAEGVGEAMQDSKNWKSHVGKGAVKGIVDAGVDQIKGYPSKGLPPQIRKTWIFRGSKMPYVPAGTSLKSLIIDKAGRKVLGRGITNVALGKVRDRFNPVMRGKKRLKNWIGS